MQALILAGGVGTRLRSISGDRQKCMVDVSGRPFLEILVLALRDSDVRKVVFAVGHRLGDVQSYFGDGSPWGVSLSYSIEPDLRGTAGAIKCAEHVLEESFLVLNGDSFLRFDYRQLARFHRERHSHFTLAVRALQNVQDYGLVELDSEDRLAAFHEKCGLESQGLVNAGVYMVERQLVGSLPSGTAISLEREWLPQLLAAGRPVYGFRAEGDFLHIGSPEGYQLAQAYFRGVTVPAR